MVDGRFPEDRTDTRGGSTAEVATKDDSPPDIDVQSSADPYLRSLPSGEDDPEKVNGGNREFNWMINPAGRVVGTNEWNDKLLAGRIRLEVHKLLKPGDFAPPVTVDQGKKTHDEDSL